MAGYQGYQPDHCWALERVPWWEPPYLLHNGREEVRLGRKEGNTKVCQGYQVSRNHVLFVRFGTPEEWQGVRWSVVDQGGVHGTYVNERKIEPHTPFPLNADDLIGVGCSETSSTRQGGRETFVYRIRAPRAFQQMVGGWGVKIIFNLSSCRMWRLRILRYWMVMLLLLLLQMLMMMMKRVRLSSFQI